MLRVAEELVEVLRDCLAGPEREERSGTPEGAPMVEEEEGRGEEEEATGMGGPTQDEEWTEEGSAANHDQAANPDRGGIVCHPGELCVREPSGESGGTPL